MKYALLSVYDKFGIVDFAKSLIDLGYEILSTGGTVAELKNASVPVTEISVYTDFPEMMGGRVKTLHPKVLGGILADRNNPDHIQDAEKHNINLIDLVAVNLYPFEETLKNKGNAIEMIDIGGPTLIRAAAKNYLHVLPIIDPKNYSEIIQQLRNGNISSDYRKDLAHKVFAFTLMYDSAIARFFDNRKNLFPDYIAYSFKKKQDLRYGENPYQQAAFYANELIEPSIVNANQLQGKEISYNNIMDADAALGIIKEFKLPSVAVIKHANPCGVAVDDNILVALTKAYNADPLSAFGCVIALNRIFTKECAEFLQDKFVEVIIALDFEQDALDILSKKKNLRLLKLPNLKDSYGQNSKHEFLTAKKVVGGLLVQTRNFPDLFLDEVKIIHNENPTKEDIALLTKEAKEGNLKELICVTKKQPNKNQLRDMVFAMKVCKHVKSNSILFAKDLTTIGIGAGQMSRVDATIIATRKSKGKSQDSVMASDAFFPFRDGIDEAIKAGISAIIQPGGSIRDKEIIDAANQHGLTMIFTGIRLFLH